MTAKIPAGFIATILWIIVYVMNTYKNPKKMILTLIVGSFITFIALGIIIGLILKIMDSNYQMSFENFFDFQLFFNSIGTFCTLYIIRKITFKK